MTHQQSHRVGNTTGAQTLLNFFQQPMEPRATVAEILMNTEIKLNTPEPEKTNVINTSDQNIQNLLDSLNSQELISLISHEPHNTREGTIAPLVVNDLSNKVDWENEPPNAYHNAHHKNQVDRSKGHDSAD